ncbi:hypothetical protein IEQ34_008282 [Dendrobium chrysotoxum]|uniref:Uncharacterized protein n=1 Tax=Dendrobium chrysotoxum TaxID=161865 RepID=A0AAV7H896_DENCH|nr:hypothetical protein IEQ34_008282 [Dendrobium chrysotoxum]
MAAGGGGGGSPVFLSPHLNNPSMGVRVNRGREGRAVRRPVLRHEPTGFEPDTARVAESLWPLRPGSPLRCLL